MKAALFLLAAFALAAPAPGQEASMDPGTVGSPEVTATALPPVELSVAVDKAEVTISDQLTYTVEVTAEPGIDPELPEFGEDLGGFRLVDMGAEGPTLLDGRRRWKRWYTLAADLVGTYVLPEMTVPYKDASGDRGQVKAPRIFVEVKTVLEPGTKDIRDLKAPEALPSSPWPIILLAGAAVLLIGVGVAVVLVVRRRRRRPQPPVPPHEQALEAMRRLGRQQLLEKGEVQRFFFELSEIFRFYLERRFSILAVESTTEELLPRLLGLAELPAPVRERTEEFLRQSDLIKFAKTVYELDELRRLAELSYQIVTETTPRASEQEGRG